PGTSSGIGSGRDTATVGGMAPPRYRRGCTRARTRSASALHGAEGSDELEAVLVERSSPEPGAGSLLVAGRDEVFVLRLVLCGALRGAHHEGRASGDGESGDDAGEVG